MMDLEQRLQNINLVVQGISIPLAVVPEEEPGYRNAVAELNARISAYMANYPDLTKHDSNTPLAVAAVDRAYYLYKKRMANDTEPIMDMIQHLNREVESFLSKYND